MGKIHALTENPMKISGVVQSGVGKGSFFTSLEWVVRQCESMLGYAPFPGTLNVRIRDRDLHKLDEFLQKTDLALIPEDPAFCCSAPIKKVIVHGVPAAIVLPAENVRVHESRIIEIISSCNFKTSFGLKDGDSVTVFAENYKRK